MLRIHFLQYWFGLSNREPKMRSTKKGGQYHFGMKVHVGVDRETKTVHTIATTPASVHDSKVVGELLRGDEDRERNRSGDHQGTSSGACTGDDAIETARWPMRRQGLSSGISTGANVAAALRIARTLSADDAVVTLQVDRADRYMSVLPSDY